MKKLLLISFLCLAAVPAFAVTHAVTAATTAPNPPLATSSPPSPTNNLAPAYPQQITVPAGSPPSTVPGHTNLPAPTAAPSTTTTPLTGRTTTNATTPSAHTFADRRDRQLKDMDVRITALQRHEKCVRGATTAAALSACPAVNFCGNAGVR